MRWSSFTLVLIALGIFGCASSPVYDDPDTRAFKLAELTKEKLREEFRAEEAYRVDGSPPRRIGLAMSGGGSKAGMFAHGVLHGLNDTGLLQQIEIISTASGSNYPTFWYFSKQIEASRLGFDARQIFDDCIPAWYGAPGPYNDSYVVATVHQAVQWAKANNYPVCNDPSHFLSDAKGEDRLRWQAHLARWPDIFETDITRVTGNREPSPWADTFWLAVRLLGEIPLTLLPIDSGVPVAYMRGIERTWGLNPLPRDRAIVSDTNVPEKEKWRYSNSTQTSFGAYYVAPESISWEKLQALYRRNPKLPLWVMNTTEGQKTTYPNMYNLYELTPFSFGSARHGYHFATPPMPTVAHGVRASAAFFDKQGAVGFAKLALSLTDGLIPAVTWGVKIQQPMPPSQAANVRLSDGGGADNLGLMSLVRRGLDQIIVVDAAQDISGGMEDLCWAKEALDREGYSLTLPALADLEEVCTSPKDNRGSKGYNVSEWKNPVITGEIRPKSRTHGNAIDVIKLFWIKAAWNEYEVHQVAKAIDQRTPNGDEFKKVGYLGLCGNQPGQINCWMPVWYAHNAGPTTNGKECLRTRTVRGKETDDCFIDFPQLKTVGSTFSASSYQFWAFRELARSYANQIYINDRGELTTDVRQCRQLAKPVRKGRRPNDWNEQEWMSNERTCISP